MLSRLENFYDISNTHSYAGQIEIYPPIALKADMAVRLPGPPHLSGAAGEYNELHGARRHRLFLTNY